MYLLRVPWLKVFNGKFAKILVQTLRVKALRKYPPCMYISLNIICTNEHLYNYIKYAHYKIKRGGEEEIPLISLITYGTKLLAHYKLLLFVIKVY